MTFIRTTFVAFVALSVAALPIGSGMARAAMAVTMSHDMSQAAGEGECCSHDKPCEKKANDCDSMAGCALKCFNYSGAMSAPLVFTVTPAIVERSALIVPGLPSPSDNPPLPPPRV